ncbi:MAG: hypothetical protein CL678_03180 [Bdellovibrionaceae bacterium]|nr:hypothetical protein [Pseudobdellovibrionaceae bacterium]|tara:strand:- start:12702 stop:13085 length:384 start_codon:yes stop_codon:yes gene_type:complete
MKFFALLMTTLSVTSFATTYQCPKEAPLFVPEDASIEELTFMDDDRVKYDECVYKYSRSDSTLQRKVQASDFIAQCFSYGCNGGCTNVVTLFKSNGKVKALLAGILEGFDNLEYRIEAETPECHEVK